MRAAKIKEEEKVDPWVVAAVVACVVLALLVSIQLAANRIGKPKKLRVGGDPYLPFDDILEPASASI